MAGPRIEGERKEFSLPPSPLRIIDRYPVTVLQKRIREITLLNDPSSRPYEDSDIEMVRVRVDDLVPCARYVLDVNLEIQRVLRAMFLAQFIDPLNLKNSGAALRFKLGNRTDVMISPIIEVSAEDNNALVVVDGLHRVVMAKLAGLKKITVIMIKGIAFPLAVMPVGWDEVRVVNRVPDLLTKRKIRPGVALTRGLGLNTDIVNSVLGWTVDEAVDSYRRFFRDWSLGDLEGTPSPSNWGEMCRKQYTMAGVLISTSGSTGEKVLLSKEEVHSEIWGFPTGLRINGEVAPEITATSALREQWDISLDFVGMLSEPLIFVDNSQRENLEIAFIYRYHLNRPPPQILIDKNFSWFGTGQIFEMMDECSIDVRFDDMFTAQALKRWMETVRQPNAWTDRPIQVDRVYGLSYMWD